MRCMIGTVLAGMVLTGCASSGPVVTKSQMGNLQINVAGPLPAEVGETRLYLDGLFIGNVSDKMPVLHARAGKRVVRAELDGYKPVEQEIVILGDPNHQVLNIVFEKQ